MIGKTLGHYEITSLLGKGGMGEVYRAWDPRVGRDVAIKISSEKFSERFEREARAVAALNHPNICTLHDVGPDYLVMELIEGETLAERIQQGAIPVDEALGIAKQIAEALEAAHEKGIIHRDLKPGNIKIRPDGTVKVLDFGLAKVTETQDTSLSHSPTLSHLATQQGIILGTAGYMSPEQARGKPVDKRADIWAFGVVLYEMLTGKRLFEGDTVSDTLAAVLTREPDWEKVPSKVRLLLRRCLEKDPKKRLRDIGDMALLLEAAPEAIQERRPWLAWGVAIVGILAALLLAIIHFREVPAEAPETRLEVSTPPTSEPTSFAISPDGRRLVFVGLAEGQQRLWLRPLDQTAAQPLAGTEGARLPFWSPDSRSIGFFAGGKLKRIDVAGGPPQVLAPALSGQGGTWNRDDVIVFTPNLRDPLYRVAASGGEPVAITRLDSPRNLSHRSPQFLPDGRRLLFFVLGQERDLGISLLSLDSGESRPLIAAELSVAFAPPDQVLFMRQGTLFAQRFDVVREKLAGDPVRLADSVVSDSFFHGGFSVSQTGVLAYRTGGSRRHRLAWFDRSGKEVGTLGAPDENNLQFPELSPDGSQVAVTRTVEGNSDIWLIETARGVTARFTFDAAPDAFPIWSPDGSRIAFNSLRKGTFDLYQKTFSGTGNDELLLESPSTKYPNDWSQDGRFLLYQQLDQKTLGDLWVLPLSGERKPVPFVSTSFSESNGQFSPDGNWVAYSSNESGREEVYVQPFPGPGRKWQISTSGGIQPRWRHDRKELFYIAPDSKLMATKVQATGQTFDVGPSVALFPTRIPGGSQKSQYAVARDGQHFLINIIADESTALPITILTNWTAGLKK